MPPAPDDGLHANDHMILVKLHDELLDWIIAGQAARRQWFVYLAAIQGYGGEIASVLVGLGIGAPVAAYVQGDAAGGGKAIDLLRQALPHGLFGLGVAALVVWGGLRVIASREDVAARALFARDFAKTMQTQWLSLLEVLRQPEPMEAILKIQQIVDRKVAEASDKGILRWDKLPPAVDAGRELEKQRRIDYIRRKFMANWKPLAVKE